MTPADAARLLAIAAVYDKRTIGEVEASAWADALDGLAPRDCAEAIKAHYADSTAWLMPAHVRERVAHRRREAARLRQNERVFAEIAQAKARAVPRPALAPPPSGVSV